MNKKMLLGLLALMVEVSYLYPLYYLAAFAGKTSLNSVISFEKILVISLVVLVINSLLSKKSFRLITIILLNILVLFFMEGYLLKSSFFPQYNIFLAIIQIPEQDLLLLFQTLTLGFFVFWVWLRAIINSHKGGDYSSAVNRLEVSVALVFVVLLIVELAAIRLPQVSLYLLLCIGANFACLSLSNNGIKSTPWLGFGYTLVFLIPTFLAITYFKEVMYSSSHVLFNFFSPLAVFFKDLLAAIFKFLLQRGNYLPPTGTIDSGQNTTVGEGVNLDISTGNSIILEKIMWVFSMIILISFLIMCVILLGKLLQKLMKRKKPIANQRENSILNYLWRILSKLKDSLMRTFLTIQYLLPNKYSVLKAYHAMLMWGRYRNLPRHPWETPSEYYLRLAAVFPQYNLHLKRITDCYLEFRYGFKEVSADGINELKNAVFGLYFPAIKKSKG
ncbi:MAG: DUF4129 domain-containing protein [Bacillota bacterium]